MFDYLFNIIKKRLFLRLFIAALWSPAGKWLASWLLFVMSNCDFVTFPRGILGQLWYLIVLIPDLYRIPYFAKIPMNLLVFYLLFQRFMKEQLIKN